MTISQSHATPQSQAILRRLAEIAEKTPELASLISELEEPLARLARLEEDFAGQVQREKLAAMQALAYGASHEINNPLANIAARAQTLLSDERDPQRRRSLATINAQAFRAHEMIADLMLFAKPPAPRKAPLDLVALANRTIAELTEEARDQGTELRRVESGTRALIVSADEVQLGVALQALLHNSLEAVRRGGRVFVLADKDDGCARLHVSDSGPGLSLEAQQHLFDPFYSGREAGRGLGLGLSKVWRIVELHGGKILVQSRPGEGTTFSVSLPTDPLSAA